MRADGSVPDARALPTHPFCWLPATSQRVMLAISALLTALTMAVIHWSNAPLQSPEAPLGMVSLQLAGTLPAAQKILAAWGVQGQIPAAFNLGIDCLYLLVYATTLSLGCVMLARSLPGPRGITALGVWLSWGVLVAALLDALENALLISLLLGDLREAWAVLAFWCAVPKFALVLAALGYLGIGGLLLMVRVGERQGAGH